MLRSISSQIKLLRLRIHKVEPRNIANWPRHWSNGRTGEGVCVAVLVAWLVSGYKVEFLQLDHLSGQLAVLLRAAHQPLESPVVCLQGERKSLQVRREQLNTSDNCKAFTLGC